MRGRLVGLCLLAVLWGSGVADAKSVALIWKGAKVQAEAEAQRSAWAGIGELLEKTKLELPQGYPKLVRSDTLAGLKPGFWVWLVGVCDPEGAATALEHLKVLAPDAYSREVAVEAVDRACPSAEGEPLVVREEKLSLPQGLKLRVFTQDEHEEPAPDEEFGDRVTLTRYHFVLTGKKGELLGTADVVGEEDFTGDVRQGATAYRCEMEGLSRAGKDTLVLTRSCRASAAECGSTLGADEVTRVTVRGTTLTRGETKRRNEQTMECGE
ncbi:hypothetical protein LY474_11265 [Myxococcus stipitatus]|uniref:hypothetical protein n=1 Tax=Myxococcus stipitatus TaxID=83455 RepID=UPI001F31C112|nr:hypothetical protein [Myxococcus stipitatus]MCE9668392.1 hypothetical protein [Myxococcus stipitatus]